MTLPNAVGSLDESLMASQDSTQTQEQIFVTNTRVKNQHLTLAQMRGVIKLFNYYFPKTPGKRMTKDEKNRRWTSYKNKIYQDYKRIITGKFSSEKALIKRYSDPLSFIKYKLKRSTNLNVDDLSEADKQYYFEIGGLEDINQLIKNTYDLDTNIDSIQNMSNNFAHYNSKRRRNSRKRRRINEIQDNDGQNDFEFNRNHNHNHNHNQNQNQNQNVNLGNVNNSNLNRLINGDLQQNDILHTPRINDVQISSVPPRLNINVNSQARSSEKAEKMTEALSFLNDKLDIFEREQLDKKKIEIFEITKQKICATKQSLENCFMNDPHLIGCIPAVEDQIGISFDCWLHKYKHIIVDDRAIQCKSLDTFINQLITLKSDPLEWNNFLTKWKLNRILFNDDFIIIWSKIKEELNIQNPTTNDQNNNKTEHDNNNNDDDNDDVDDDDDDEETDEIKQD